VKKIQVQGVHHITLVGSTKQSAIDFWQGTLGMPFIFEQPNLGKPDENHLYFDPGDGRLLTVFTNESLGDARRHAPREVGCVEHIAFNVSRATFMHAPRACANAASSSFNAIVVSWTRSTSAIPMA
jgi:catechol 2,3-dioxygenase-like lactoylglutathione lyase family enzyme